MDEFDDIVAEFLVESYENLDQLDRDLLELEQDPTSRERLSSIFRTVHTIKGTSGFLAFNRLEEITHLGENLLARLRDGKLTLTRQRTDVLLSLVDCLRSLLAEIETSGREGTADVSQLAAAITRSMKEDEPAAAEPQIAPPAPELAPVPDVAPVLEAVRVREAVPMPEAASMDAAQLDTAPAPVPAVLDPDAADDSGSPLDPVRGSGRRVSDTTIRVDVDLLDALMLHVGELVLTRNQIVQYASRQPEPDLVRAAQRLNLIASELQEGVMKTRMQPIDHIWSKLPRVVRDLGQSCGKSVRLEMEGGETELDKTLLEAVKDPLTHLVRNSIDHGIEAADVRLAYGKPAEGTLSLRAFHEGGLVVVEVADDGCGIDPARVRAKAVERGLITLEQQVRMTDREALDLIFMPGLSTAAAVTNVSGRGVGMDVVRSNVEKIGGTVDIHSRLGQSTTVRVKIPLTLAIIPALVVSQSDARYAIPQASLLELVRLEGANMERAIEHVAGVAVFRLRERLLPLVDLGDVLERPSTKDDGVVNIVVLQVEDTSFGLVVDHISDTQEIVVKPLGRQLKSVDVFAGATIMGDGKVALILDVSGVAARSGAVPTGVSRGSLHASEEARQADEDTTALLVVTAGRRRCAVPLGLVSRLEEIDAGSVEIAGGQEVVQYRGSLLSLIRIADVLGMSSSERSVLPDGAPLPVVVHQSPGGDMVGLIVDEIVDIAEEHVTLRQIGHRTGIVGSTVVQGRVTDLIDVESLLRAGGSPASIHLVDEVLHVA